MKRKKTILLVSVIFVIFAAVLVTVVVKSTLNETAVAENDISADDTKEGAVNDDAQDSAGDDAEQAEDGDDAGKDTDSAGGSAAASSEIKEAEALIGQTLTRDEIEDTLGECEKFDMSSDGCERGVYAGRFYYDGYAIFSRTYDKGQTFSIVSVSE